MGKDRIATMIWESDNYNRFELLDFNRDVRNTKKTKKLKQSMEKRGFLNEHPMVVIKNDNTKFKIKCGHHRFTVAKDLGIPIKYVISDDDMDIYDDEDTKNKWSNQNYLESHVRRGSKAHIAVKEYHEKTGIPLSACISMLAGNSAGSGNYDKKFKIGQYRLGNQTHADIISELVIFFSNIDLICATHINFVRALSKIIWIEELDLSVLKYKFKKYKTFVEKQTSVGSYIEMIEAIHNRQNQNKLPIFFLANEIARKRCVCQKNKTA